MLSFILFVLIVVFLLIPVFTYLIFWYEAANSTYGMTLDQQSDGKPFLWLLRGILSSICSNVVVVSLFPLGFFKSLWKPGPDSAKTGAELDVKSDMGVVLIHGIYHNASAWAYYRWRLKRKGYGRIHVFSYSSWNTTFWDIYEKFEMWMKQVEMDCVGVDMVMVGHSLGGLLAKTYAGKQDESRSSVIRRVITLVSPFKGSKMAVLGLGSLAESLRYQGPLVRELENFHPSTQQPCVAFYSPVDNMVLPAESLMPPAGWKRERTVPMGHVAALHHGPTFERVLSYLEETISDAGKGDT
jgi:pimeloyl-ACP methyl ester carboxylesterase